MTNYPTQFELTVITACLKEGVDFYTPATKQDRINAALDLWGRVGRRLGELKAEAALESEKIHGTSRIKMGAFEQSLTGIKGNKRAKDRLLSFYRHLLAKDTQRQVVKAILSEHNDPEEDLPQMGTEGIIIEIARRLGIPEAQARQYINSLEDFDPRELESFNLRERFEEYVELHTANLYHSSAPKPTDDDVLRYRKSIYANGGISQSRSMAMKEQYREFTNKQRLDVAKSQM